MADLSKVQTRVGQQDRAIGRRSSIVPDRRDTRAPDLRAVADMRSAARGDGGADELRRVFGVLQGAAADFQRYANNKFEADEEERGHQGAFDAANGTFDAAQWDRSRAYRQTVSRGRAQQSWYEHLQRTDEGLRELLQTQENADPAVRRREIDAYLEQSFREYALDPETGEPRGFGDPSAMRWVAEQMASIRPQLRQNAFTQADERLNEQAITTSADSIRAALRAGLPLDLDDASQNLPPSVDRRVARRAFITTVREVAAELEEADPVRSLQLIDQLLGVMRGGPGSTVQPADIPPSEPAQAAAAVEAGATYHSREDAIGVAIRELQGLGLDVSENRQTGRFNAAAHTTGEAHGSFMADINVGRGNVEADNPENRQRFDELAESYRSRGFRILWNGRIYEPGAQGTRAIPRGKNQHRNHLHIEAPQSIVGRSAGAPQGDPDFRYAEQAADPVEQAAASSGAQVIPSLTGAFALNPQERAELREFRSALANRIEVRNERAEREAHQENAGLFLDRLNGMGTYPTAAEIRQARSEGRIGPEQAGQLLGMIQSDRDRVQRDADRAMVLEERESRLRRDRQIESVMAPLYAGQLSTSQINASLLNVAATIRDADQRREVIGAVRSELSAFEQLRQQSPDFRSGVEALEVLRRRMLRDLPARPRGGRERAVADIEAGFNSAMTQLGRAATGAQDVRATVEHVTRTLMDNYDRAYGR